MLIGHGRISRIQPLSTSTQRDNLNAGRSLAPTAYQQPHIATDFILVTQGGRTTFIITLDTPLKPKERNNAISLMIFKGFGKYSFGYSILDQPASILISQIGNKCKPLSKIVLDEMVAEVLTFACSVGIEIGIRMKELAELPGQYLGANFQRLNAPHARDSLPSRVTKR